MKKTLLHIAFLMLLPLAVFAQGTLSSGGNNNPGNAEMNREMDRRMEDYEKAKEKNLKESLANLKEELQLDELQFIAISQIVNDGIRTEGVIMKKEENNEDKSKAIKAHRETTDAKIKALLNKEQIEKYDALKASGPKKKKKKTRAKNEQSEAK